VREEKGAVIAMATHTVKQGECLSKIAERYGFMDWHTIYDHPQNEEFKRQRPNPYLIHPGDTLFIPDRQSKQAPCATGGSHRFVVRSLKKALRLAIQDIGGKRIANAPYKLTVEGKLYEGTTDSEGMVATWIPVRAEEGTLEVEGYLWPLKIGHLNPLDDVPDEGVSGIQARLRNLGHDPGPIDGKLGPRTRAAIRAFQRRHPPLKVDGVSGPKTRAKLVEKYGC
jgi:hypothetical protein